MYNDINQRAEEFKHLGDQNIMMVQKIDDLNGEISKLKHSNQETNESNHTVETMLRVSYQEIEGLKSLVNTLATEKRRLISELKRLTKRPSSNFIETDILKKKALNEIWCAVNVEIK